MTPRLALGLLLLTAGCGRQYIVLPRPQLRCIRPPEGTQFFAGFGRRDITPPPGAGMLGYGPEARVSAGYRQRLTVRAMALQDTRGERLILAVADLDFIPGILHREVAARVEACLGITADRIVLSATHTHSGPAHFTAHAAYDDFGSGRVAGFDPQLLAFLADRIAEAMFDALGRMRPARAGWGQTQVWNVARIRSLAAHRADPHDWPAGPPPDTVQGDDRRHVDPTLTVFRVDTLGRDGPVPAGAWALFAVHGTGIPAPNDVYDADVPGVAARTLELGIEQLNGNPPYAPAPRAIAGFANSAEGDVLPVTRFDAVLCSVPVLRQELRPGSWRTPAFGARYIDRPGFKARECVDQGIEDTRAVGVRLGEAAVRLFAAMADSLSDQIQVSRMFRAVPLRGPEAPALLCAPMTGTSQVAGAETRETRLKGFRLFGILASDFVPGGRAIRRSSSCDSPKRTLKLLQSVLAGDHGFEELAQFTVARIGDALLGSVPFEATTTVGARMRDAMREAAGTTQGPRRVMVLGLVNNYIGYVPTLLEYQQQYYEGGSALYGPASAQVYTEQLAGLTRALAAAGWTSPAVEVPDFPSFASNPASLVSFRWGTPPSFAPTDLRLGTRDARPELRWEDDEPGWVIVHRPRVVVVEQFRKGEWTPAAGDGTLDLEIRWRRDRSGARAEWSALWVAAAGTGRFRFRVIDPRRPDAGATAEFTR